MIPDSKKSQNHNFDSFFFVNRNPFHFPLMKIILFAIFIFICTNNISSADFETIVSQEKQKGDFTLSASGKSAPIIYNTQDYAGVIRVIGHLQRDIENVTGAKPILIPDLIPKLKEAIIIGTIGKSPIIDNMIQNKKLNVEGIAGKWETFLITVIDNPLPDVDRALIITGSDKRGTIFGIYDLSEKIGVSPWYWWADVPVKKQPDLYIKPVSFSRGEPKVKYRGIFINDEAPALSGWSMAKYGTDMFNHKLYEHVFELLLRLKGNFLWPAMWGRAFYDDDSLNPKLADEYGIVISTSHHEPMMRAHIEWQRYGSGPWNYEKNETKLREFWRKGIERMGNYESVVTLAMRGDGDEAMSSDANVSLLEKIVKDQREILAEVTGKPVESIPQVWALYKEVQEYYDKGMRVPDDVTVLLCDDNWGNIRKLPKLDEKPRKGGYGIYYHFDYVGGPRNYKWLNTNQIERVWEQMHLAYEYNARKIWIVNVGDIKPMEFPISFFLDYAWNPEKWSADQIPEYTRQWAERQFGKNNAGDIADILSKYTKYNSRRKPELLSPDTYSLINYREAETVVDDYNKLTEKAQKIYDSLPAEYKDAFYQMVLHPAIACANLNDLYVTVAKNRLYAAQGRALTNELAEKAKGLYLTDSLISVYFNKTMAKGKWDHMMDQTHIGYTNWQQPDFNSMPKVKVIDIPNKAEMGIAVEGSDKWWPYEKSDAVLPEFDKFNQQSYYIDIFNRGSIPYKFTIKSEKPWLMIDSKNEMIEKEKRIWISINWKKVPKGKHRIPVEITGPDNKKVIVQAVVLNPSTPLQKDINAFVESNGYISIEADHFSKVINSSTVNWQKIPNLGRTGSSMCILPVSANSQKPEDDSPRLEYKFYLFTTGELTIKTYLSPTLNFNNEGIRYAVSIDDEQPQIVNINQDETTPDWKYPMWWNQIVGNNIRIKETQHKIMKEGEHILKFWFVDPGIVLQKIVIETGDVKPSYLGPPESFRGINNLNKEKEIK